MNNCWWHHFLPWFDHQDEVFLLVPNLAFSSRPCVGLQDHTANAVNRSNCSYDLGCIRFLYVEKLRIWGRFWWVDSTLAWRGCSLKVAQRFEPSIPAEHGQSRSAGSLEWTGRFYSIYFKDALLLFQDFPGGPMVKNLPCNAGDLDLIPGWEPSGCVCVFSHWVLSDSSRPRGL